jgi:nucleoside-diphosphate-sugar epimerase
MKFLVTGATGFIGSHIVDLLLADGYEVKCIARKTSNLRWLKDKPVELIEASINDSKSLIPAVEGVDVVIHSAGLTAAKNYNEYLAGNRDGVKNLLNSITKVNPDLKRFVFLSSLTAAGPSKSLENPVTEDDECRPITSYGKSKREAELVLLAHHANLPYTIIRPPAVYGPRDTATFDIFKTIQKGFGPLIGFNPKFASIIHSSDLAKWTINAALNPIAENKTYFISSEKFYSWDLINSAVQNGLRKEKVLKIKIPHSLVMGLGWISEQFGRFSSKPPVFNYEKGIDFIQNYWTCSVEKAKNELGFKQEVSLEDGMRETAEWYIQNKWL